jgi:predicted TIM-barrel fold metal-dependent hydrolase
MSKVPVLVDANGSFGKKSSGEPDYPAIADRLAYMNRFGISRALVWNVESLQNHAGSSNRKLLDEIASTPGARGRIIPCLSISGFMDYETGGVKQLVAQMKEGATRALRFANVFGRMTLRQLDPVMPAILKFKPFLVMRFDQAATQDILEFTGKYPSVSVILTEVSWGPCITVFDLMRQRKNILVDNSWLHSYGAIELVVKRFGADRLVFGTGNKAHSGAAIGALARADLSESDRRLVACGNLERLTGLKATPAVAPVFSKGNTVWQRFLDGKPLTVDVIDAHGHLGPSGGYVLEAQDESLQMKRALKDMDAIGIRTMLFSGLQALMGGPVEGNDLLERLLQPHADRLQGYVVYNPNYGKELIPQLDRYFKGPVFAGFKTLCDYWSTPITDSRFTPMWEYANRHRLPVLNHTWNGVCDSPAQFRDIVPKYPHVPFLFGHSGGGDGGRREAVELARAHKNVYLEWCGSFTSAIPWEKTLAEVPAGQVVFGTDALVHDFNWELARLLSLDAPDATIVPILGSTMRRLLAGRK